MGICKGNKKGLKVESREKTRAERVVVEGEKIGIRGVTGEK